MSEPRTRLRWTWLIAIFALALAPRWATVSQYEQAHPMAAHPVIDEAAYDDWAVRLAQGDWLGEEVFFQEPLYAYSLGVVYAVAGHRPGLVRRLQVVLDSLTAVGVALIGAALFGRLAGLLAGVALALHRTCWLFCALLLKPVAVLFCLTALALALIASRRSERARPWLAVGLLAGAGALLRGNLLVMLPFLCLWPGGRWLVARVHARREGREGRGENRLGAPAPAADAAASAAGALRATLWLVLGIACALAPVFVRNYAVAGQLVLTTSGAGTNLYGGNNAENPYGVATEFDWVRGIPEHEADDWRREAQRRSKRELNASEVSSFWAGAVLESLRADPWLHARILWRKLRLALSSYEVPDNHDIEWDARYLPLLAAWPLGFGAWGSLGLAGLLAAALGLLARPARAERGARGLRVELALLWLLYLGTIVLTVMSMRIRLALMPLLCPFAGAYLARAFELRRAGRALARLSACWLVAGLVVSLPVLDAATRAGDRDEREYNLAVQQVEQGQLAQATTLARALAARHPGSQRLQTLLAQIALLEVRRVALAAGGLDRAGRERLEQAYARVRAAHASAREEFRAEAIAGLIALERGLPATAREHLARARRFDPDDAELALAELRASVQQESQAFAGAAPSEESRAALAALLARTELDDRQHCGASILLAEVDFAIAAARLRALEARAAQSDAGSGEAGEAEPSEAVPDASAAAEVESARARIRTALQALRELCEGSPARGARAPELIAAARLAAARLQLEPVLQGFSAAANHARAALALGAGDEARWLLARALAHDGRGDASAQALGEARALLRELSGRSNQPATALLLELDEAGSD